MEDINKYIDYSYIPIICGPTASGKSSLALKLCRKLNGELISCDSMQIYKGLDIGTAKDTGADLIDVPHHMIDIVEPGTYFSVNDFKLKALDCIEDILSRGKLPVICGGTGQYVSALYLGLEFGDNTEIDDKTNTLYAEFQKDGIDGIYERLLKADPIACEKIHANDTRRVIRALAVYEATGKTFTEKNNESHKGAKYPFKLYNIDIDRAVLYDRINKRVDIMIEQGLVDEARKLYDLSCDKKSTCFQAIGYKELLGYLNGDSSLEDAIYNIKLRSRHYAKRQLTWFRYMEDIKMLPTGQDENNIQTIIKDICPKT